MSGDTTEGERAFLAGGGEAAELIARIDWTATALGPIGGWPQSLRTAVALILRAPVPMVTLWGEDGVMIYNDAYAAFSGHRHPAIFGRNVREAWPEAADFNDNVMKVGLAGGTLAYRDEELVLSIRGRPEQVWLNLDYSPIPGEDGRPAGVMAIVVDTTAKVRAELALRESETRFRLVAESAPVMLWMSDAEGHCVYLNAMQRAFWGVEPDEVASFDWTGTVHPDDRPAMAGEYAKAMSAHTRFALEMRIRRADGSYRRIQTNALPRFDGDGGFVGMIGVNVDVTELRETEAAIRAESERLAILNRTGAAIAAEMDVAAIAQLACDAGTSLTGAAFGAFLYDGGAGAPEGTPLLVASGAPRLTSDAAPMPRSAEIFGPTFRRESIVRADDGAGGMPAGFPPARSYLAVPVAARTGEVIGGLFFGHPDPGRFDEAHEAIVLGIAAQAATAMDRARLFEEAERELAERRRAEASLQALNETLEQRVADAIAERSAAEEALRQSQKMEAIGKLTGGVAHDFNNLLQVINGNLQLLARDLAADVPAQSRIAQALVAVGHGAKLASQLLAFGRRQPLDPKVVNLGRLVGGMSELLRRTIGEGIEVETMVSGRLWNTLADPAQLETAVLNLAINARDAMGAVGKLTIEVGNAELDEAYALANSEVTPGPHVMLAISDTGTGIPPAILDQVFEPFFSTKPAGKGSGLGLSMVYGFVKQSGGHVKIYSEPGQGTTVRIYLPRVDRKEDLPVATDDGPVAGGTETILVAEDDEDVRATVVALLRDLGYRVLTAKDAASALGVIESGIGVDLLFTDVVMPGPLRSTELARIVRERHPRVAVLFTSGYTENSIVHGGKLDPGLELLSKPYTQQSLARKLRQVLGKAPAAAAPPAEPAPWPGRVLLCEDDALIRMNTADILREGGMTVVEAGTGRQALMALDGTSVDVCVIDVGLPDMSGVDLARQVREGEPEMPVIFATGHAQVAAADGMPRVTVLTKPYEGDALIAAIARLVGAMPESAE